VDNLSIGSVVPGDKEMRYKLDKNTLNAEKNGHLDSRQIHLDMWSDAYSKYFILQNLNESLKFLPLH